MKGRRFMTGTKDMSKIGIVFAVALALAFGMTACGKKTTSERTSDAMKSAEKDVKEAAQEAGEAVVDAAKATDKAIDSVAE